MVIRLISGHPGGDVHVTLAFNPSHLEIISPVVQGSVRARQDRRDDHEDTQVLPILIHGDAAFAGQGIVMETLNLTLTTAYGTGGTVHVIINNQIGFTTSDPLDSRSTLYCTDVAKMVQAPIFHVNGDDPEAVVFVAGLALEYRMEFGKDVVLDLVCYRKHGHSEADEPSVTQPLMYKAIRNHAGIKQTYPRKLIDEGVVDEAGPERLTAEYITALENNVVVSRPYAEIADTRFLINFDPYRDTQWRDSASTSIDPDRIGKLSACMLTAPETFKLHRAVARIMKDRNAMAAGERPLDWGFCELLAYASLLDEGIPVRITGQDCERGTFFHRHAVMHDADTGEEFTPLKHVSDGQPDFSIYNSTLSEEAVLAFEYGYACSAPDRLVIWEAQFGDFVNTAQVVIDQFIASCEEKWGRFCGLVMLLPHGSEGAGPEHSSARLERFLQLCAEDNMQVCVPTTPAQMFHMLRRQMLRPYRKPLIVMSPKSLLRHKLSVSTLDEIEHGAFLPVIDEIDELDPDRVHRLIACSGKVYFDLLEARRNNGIDDTAILRIEQLYPFPNEEILNAINKFPQASEITWVQEEPRNQGAWSTVLSKRHLGGCLQGANLGCIARPYAAAPAVGHMSLHLEQQEDLVNRALLIGEYSRQPTQKTA